MSLLQTLKSLLGLESSQREPRRNGDVGVTVERDPEEPDPPSSPTGAAEPDAQSEHEVKGTDEATGADADSSSETADTDDDTETVEIEDAEPADSEAAGEALTEIKGIGAAYADRLEAAGIADTAALADADPETLAAETDLSEKRLGRWVERARNR